MSAAPSVLRKHICRTEPYFFCQIQATPNSRTRSKQIAKADQERLDDSEIAVLRAKLLSKQETVKAAVRDHVRRCAVVVTTTTLAYMPTSPIAGISWDTLIIDEVTMVPPAVVAFLASMARKRLLLAGDPRQLGPVYEVAGHGQDVHEWLGKDIFEKGRISTGSNENRQIRTNDGRLARITTQRRCAPDIWSKVKHLYPEVNQGSPQRTVFSALPPAPNEAIVLLDTSGGEAKCERVQGSWQNSFTAGLAIEVATTIAAEATGTISIAIICPYRAQVRLLRAAIREERKADTSPSKTIKVEAGTVHQFQGGEADVVIFDVVDGVGRDALGMLLRDDMGLRLANVAITRAKGKLIVIADKAWYSRIPVNLRNPLLTDLILAQPAVKQLKVLPAPQPSTAAGSSRKKTDPRSPIEPILLEAMLRYPELADVETQFEIFDENRRLVSIADFAFPAIKYAVYADGKWHMQQGIWQRDHRKRNSLTRLGWGFSVYTGREINRDAPRCANEVARTVRARK